MEVMKRRLFSLGFTYAPVCLVDVIFVYPLIPFVDLTRRVHAPDGLTPYESYAYLRISVQTAVDVGIFCTTTRVG